MDVRLPDGTVIQNVPDNITKSELISRLAKNGYETSELMAATAEPVSRTDKVLKGVRDPIDAGAQMLTKALPDSVVKAGNRLNNFIADTTGLVARLPEGGVDQQVREKEAAYQARRAAAGETGFDGYRTIGNLVSPANVGLGYATNVGRVSSLGGRMLQGVGQGSVLGAFQPVTEGDFASEKTKQIGLGGVTGGLAPVVTESVARAIRPNTSASARLLMKEGVTPTPGQILGGRMQVLEDKLTSLPIVGDAIASARGKSLDEFNRAAYGRAPKSTGGNVPSEIGRDGVASVRQQLGNKYDDLLPKLSFKADPQFAQELGTLQQMATNLAPNEAKKFESILRDHVSKLSPNGGMRGETFKVVESALNSDIKRFSASPDAYQQELANALKETLRVFRSTLERSNPNYADELGKINTGYANYARIRDAASRQGASDGKFTPSQLAAAVRAGDKTVGKRAYSEGTALMQDLSDAGKEVLAQKYPDSGTAGRAIVGGLTAGGLGYFANPVAIGGATLATLPYLPGGRQLAAALLAKRPELAQPVADVVRKTSPLLVPALMQVPQLTQSP